MSPKKQLAVKHPPKRGGTLMGMRSGFRRMTGHKDRKRAPSGSPLVQRAFVIGLGAIIVFVIAWGLAKR